MVLKALVAESDVISMAPWDVVAEEVRSGQLALLNLPTALLQHSAYGLVSRAGQSLSPAASQWQRLLLKLDQQAVAPPTQ